VFTQTHSYQRCESPEELEELTEYYKKVHSTDWHSLVILRHNEDVVIFDNNFTINDPSYLRIASMPFRTKVKEVLEQLNITSKSNVNLHIANFSNSEYNMCRKDSCRFIVEVCKTYINGYVNISRVPYIFYQRINF
jgi:hypothetical protein